MLYKEIAINLKWQKSGKWMPIFRDVKTSLRFPQLVMIVQIAEATLLAHGIKRKLFTKKEAANLTFKKLTKRWQSQSEYHNFKDDFNYLLCLRHNVHASKKQGHYSKLSSALGKNFYDTLTSMDRLVKNINNIE